MVAVVCINIKIILKFLQNYSETYLFHSLHLWIQEDISIDIPLMWNQTDKLHYFGTVNSYRRHSKGNRITVRWNDWKGKENDERKIEGTHERLNMSANESCSEKLKMKEYRTKNNLRVSEIELLQAC